ncbi:flagellar biosynthesis protein [Candidatus Dependentiae bacterium]|nr:flagellar biosynthesis protein [Candidatus Dependentiae bacterium]
MITGERLNFNTYQPIISAPVKKDSTAGSKTGSISGDAFEKILQSALDDSKIKFSGHAKERLVNRNIELDAEKVQRLNDAVDRARAKGAKETLVLLDDVAMVVSVKNNTVITVITGETLKENVFTNIDSAVLA